MTKQLWGMGLFVVAAACSSGLGRPAVTPESPRVTGVSASGLQLGVGLHVENPNPFPLVAHGVTGTLFLAGDRRVGTGSASFDQPIEGKSSGEVDSQLEIAWSSVGALRELVGMAEVPYRFEGELEVSGGPLKLSVPFELRGQLTREQLIAAGTGALGPLLR